MKILLLNAPYSEKIIREGRCMQREGAWTTIWSPVTLATIAAMLEKEDFEVKILDCPIEFINFVKLRAYIQKYSPQIVLINSTTLSIENDLYTTRLIKQVNPSIKTALFGIHVTVFAKECLKKEPNLDFIIREEPEGTALGLSHALKNKKNLSLVKGISYRKEAGIIHNEKREYLNLNALPYPAWHLVNLNSYKLPFSKKPFVLINTSRGCPYQCIFCTAKTYYGEKLRVRSPLKIVDELEYVQKRYGVNYFLFWSDNFTLDNNFVKRICRQILNRNLKVNWICNSRVDKVELGLLKLMKKAGCWMISFGIESGNQKILEYAQKGITLTQSEEAVKLAKIARLKVTGHFILGLPGETKKTMLETLEFAKKLDLDFVQFYSAVPFPGSKLFEMAKNKGWINSQDWSKFELNFSILDMPNIKAKEVMDSRRKAYKSFYLRPKQILRTIKYIKSPIYFFKMAKSFINWI